MAIFVHKFGGASLATADNVRNIHNIISEKIESKSIIVVSAMGKMTNALEKVAEAIYQGHDWQQEVELVKTFHLELCKSLFDDTVLIEDQINDILIEIEWIADEVNDNYDYIYDQIVSIGELLSSTIVQYYLSDKGVNISLVDARDLISTDQSYRRAIIDWTTTQSKVKAVLDSNFGKVDYIITQGFIGVDDENNTTTLGREGSDYTASILAKCSNAESVTVWKDVPGIMSADPKKYDIAKKIDQLSYSALYAMADAGAKVIHPKTILPLKEANIPLVVKSYAEPNTVGTTITNQEDEILPPIVTRLDDQRYIRLTPTQFQQTQTEWSILNQFEEQKLDVNFFQKHALSYSICVRDEFKLQAILDSLSPEFSIESNTGISLVTILQTTPEIQQTIIRSNTIVMEQRSANVYRCIMKSK